MMAMFYHNLHHEYFLIRKSTVNDSDGLKNFVIWHVSYYDFNLPPVPFAGFDIFKMQDLPLNLEFVLVAVSHKKREERAKKHYIAHLIIITIIVFIAVYRLNNARRRTPKLNYLYSSVTKISIN